MILNKQYTLRSFSLRNFLRPFFTRSNCNCALQHAVLRHLQSAFSPLSKRPAVPSKQNHLQYNTTQTSKQCGFPVREMPISSPDPMTSRFAWKLSSLHSVCPRKLRAVNYLKLGHKLSSPPLVQDSDHPVHEAIAYTLSYRELHKGWHVSQ